MFGFHRVHFVWITPKAQIAIGLFPGAAAGCLMLRFSGTSIAVPVALLLGLSIGAESNLIAVLTARHFA